MNELSLWLGMLRASGTLLHDPLHTITEIRTTKVDLSDKVFPRSIRRSASVSYESPVTIAALGRAPTSELLARPPDFEPVRCGSQAGGRPIVAPSILSRGRNGAAADGIEHDVANQFEKMGLPLDQDAFRSCSPGRLRPTWRRRPWRRATRTSRV